MITFIQAGTGTGKTVLVPGIVIDCHKVCYPQDVGAYSPTVLVTQPTRYAARHGALQCHKNCRARGSNLTVGYVMSGENDNLTEHDILYSTLGKKVSRKTYFDMCQFVKESLLSS